MKIIKKSKIQNKIDIEHIEQERYILRFHEHPFLTKMHFAFQSERKLYFVTDFYSGGDLLYYIRTNGRLQEDVVKIYLAQVIIAIEYLHSKNIIYRALTPESIVFDSHGYIRLNDFSLSKTKIKKSYDCTGSFCGTCEYIAPEIIEGKRYGKCCDIWCIGILMFEMLYGHVPFSDENLNQLYKKIIFNEPKFDDNVPVSPEGKELIKSLLTKNMTKRMDISELKDHDYFSDINFDDLYRKRLPVPIKPSNNENEYIDPEILSEKAQDSESNSFAEIVKKDYYNFEFCDIITDISDEEKASINLWDNL